MKIKEIIPRRMSTAFPISLLHKPNNKIPANEVRYQLLYMHVLTCVSQMHFN